MNIETTSTNEPSPYFIIGGAGQVGYYLTKALIGSGYEVTLLEKDSHRVSSLGNELGGDVVVLGDACEARTLAAAGCERAGYVLAVTGDDEDNLVICQIAKSLGANRTIARVNNIDHIPFFTAMGIDIVVSPTHNIFETITTELSLGNIVHLASTSKATHRPVEIVVPRNSPAKGRSLKSLQLTSDIRMVLILRGDTSILPEADTIIEISDKIFAVVTEEGEQKLLQLLIRRE